MHEKKMIPNQPAHLTLQLRTTFFVHSLIENNLVEEPKIRITPPTIYVTLLADYTYVTTPYNPKILFKSNFKR